MTIPPHTSPAVDDVPGAGEHELTFIAWTWVEGRSAELAQALGGIEQRYYAPGSSRKPLVLVRYAISALRTAHHILRHRPAAVIVQNPPLLAPLSAYLAAQLTGTRIVLDSHPAAFVRTGPRRAIPNRVIRWLVRRARVVLVTVGELAEQVEEWGGRAIIVHEAPAHAEPQPPLALTGRPRVVFVCRFAADEPVEEVVEAARALPGVDVVVTGAQDKCPPGLAASAPDNVEFPGFLPGAEYRQLLASAHLVMSLTTRPEAVCRSAYDAVWALRPLVFSGGEHLDELFPCGVRVENARDSIADGVRGALDRYDELAGGTGSALAVQQQRWRDQLSQLRAAVGLP